MKVINNKIVLCLLLLLSILCFEACKDKEDLNEKDNIEDEENNEEYIITCHQQILDIPENKTFEECTDKENLYIAIGKTIHSKYYQSQITGLITGDKWFITYSQSLNTQRIINNTQYYSYGVSLGSFKKYVSQKLINEFDYYWREGKMNNDTAVFEDIYYQKEKDYYTQFGQGPWGVTSYSINDSSIKDIKKEKVDNEYVYQVELDPILSTEYYKYEIKNTIDSKDFPEFKKITVNFTISTDWTIKSVHYFEEYEISNLGGISCTSDIIEDFAYSDIYISEAKLEEFKSLLDMEQ